DQPVLGAEAVDRGDVDDRAAASRGHGLDHRPHPEEAADLIDVDDGHVVGQCRVDDGGRAQDGGVVHEHLEVAELGSGGDGSRPVGFLGDVDVDVDGGTADVGGDLLALVVQHIADDDGSPFAGEQASLGL